VLVDLYLTFAGDSLEVGRHLVGPLDRLSVMLVISIAIGADAIWHIRRPAGVDKVAAEASDEQLVFGVAQDA